jgi:hypothetical protein
VSTCAIPPVAATSKRFLKKEIAPLRSHNIQTSDWHRDGFAKRAILGSERGDSKRGIKFVPARIKALHKDVRGAIRAVRFSFDLLQFLN